MAIGTPVKTKNESLVRIREALCGGGATLVIGTANMAATLITFPIASEPGLVSDGSLTLNVAAMNANASAGGAAASAVLKRGDGTAVLRGLTVGVSGSGADIIISSTTITSGNPYAITSAVIADASTWTPPTIYYFDASRPDNTGDGLSEATAKKTFTGVMENITFKYGDVIRLKRGQTWNDTIWFGNAAAHANAHGCTIEAYGTGANPKIDRVNRAGHGIVCYAQDLTVRDIDVANCQNGFFVYGNEGNHPLASASFIRCNATGCNGGFVAGAGTVGGLTNVDKGGRFHLIDNCTANNSVTPTADGIQISEDASAGVHTIRNTTCTGNAVSGINHKSGTAIIENCKLYTNGQAGMLSQVHASFCFFSDNQVYDNNTANAGVFNVALENAVSFFSSRNIYANPRGGSGFCNNINISGGGSGVTGNPKFYSVADIFIANNITNFIAHIMTAQSSIVDVIDVRHASFFGNSGGRAIDGRNMGPKVHLLVQNCAFSGTNMINIAYRRTAIPGTRINGNAYYRSDAGAVVEIYNDTPSLITSYTGAQIATMRTTEATDSNSIAANPTFKDPTAWPGPDFRLTTGSAALAAGIKAILADPRDNNQQYFPRPFSPTAPNIGAIAAAGA